MKSKILGKNEQMPEPTTYSYMNQTYSKFMINFSCLRIAIIQFVLCLAIDTQAQDFPFAKSDDVVLTDAQTLLVTHSSTVWDWDSVSRDGLVQLIENFKTKQGHIVYLIGRGEASTYFFKNLEQAYYIRSASGEFSFFLPTNDLLVAGGFLEACLAQTIRKAVVQMKANHLNQAIQVTLVQDAIFLIPPMTGPETLKTMLQRLSLRNQMEKLSEILGDLFIKDQERTHSLQVWLNGQNITKYFPEVHYKKNGKPLMKIIIKSSTDI